MAKEKSTRELLASCDVARLANLTPASIRNSVKQGKLTPSVVTPGGIRLFDMAEVERFLAERAEHKVA